jgi:hypothetical protein
MKRTTSIRRRTLLRAAVSLAVLAMASPVLAEFPSWGILDTSYTELIQQVVNMPMDGDLQARASRHGLNVVNVMWEDTGRSAGSSIGPNISDLTLQVRERRGQGFQPHLLPVLRYPNFTTRPPT